MLSNCPKCGNTNRTGAKFCANCGTPLAPPASSVSADEVVEKARQAASKAGAAVGPAASKAASSIGPAAARAGAAVTPVAKEAAAAVAPLARDAAVKGWAGSKRGMSLFARVMTVGGRAAYGEIFSPQPATRGQVITQPVASTSPARIEPAAILFAISLLAGWLVFALSEPGRIIAIAAIFMTLLVLSWLGLRRPFFTRITFSGLGDRLRRRAQAANVPTYEFRVAEGAAGQPLDVVIIGEHKGRPVSQGDLVELWGIRDPKQSKLRVWKVESVDASGQPAGTLTAPRLIPLSVALFVPAVLLLVAWLGTLI